MKFKVGDKVRCITDQYTYVTQGNVYEVIEVDTYFITLQDDEGDIDSYYYSSFEPVTKTLDNLEVGDILVKDNLLNRTVEAVCGNVVFFSFGLSASWDLIKALKKEGWKLKDPEKLEPKVKKAIKLLEKKGYKVEK